MTSYVFTLATAHNNKQNIEQRQPQKKQKKKK